MSLNDCSVLQFGAWRAGWHAKALGLPNVKEGWAGAAIRVRFQGPYCNGPLSDLRPSCAPRSMASERPDRCLFPARTPVRWRHLFLGPIGGRAPGGGRPSERRREVGGPLNASKCESDWIRTWCTASHPVRHVAAHLVGSPSPSHGKPWLLRPSATCHVGQCGTFLRTVSHTPPWHSRVCARLRSGRTTPCDSSAIEPHLAVYGGDDHHTCSTSR